MLYNIIRGRICHSTVTPDSCSRKRAAAPVKEVSMDTRILIELFGYLGSFLVVISMLMTSVKKLRIVNTIGSSIFTIYALIIRSYPTALMNLCLVIINIIQLIKLSRANTSFNLVKAAAGTGAVRYLLDYYAEDIKIYFPEVAIEDTDSCDTAFIILLESTPAGVMVGNMRDGDTVDMKIDYALPAYRDCSVGTFLYSRLPEYGIKRLTLSGGAREHEVYMKKMGFVRSGDTYIKEL